LQKPVKKNDRKWANLKTLNFSLYKKSGKYALCYFATKHQNSYKGLKKYTINKTNQMLSLR